MLRLGLVFSPPRDRSCCSTGTREYDPAMFPRLKRWFRHTRRDTRSERAPTEHFAADISASPADVNVDATEYARRIEREIEYYLDDVDVHALPDIFHYWSNRYIRPMFEGVGTTHPEDLFVKYLLEAASASKRSSPRFVSIGAGNCDVECGLADQLVARGLDRFTFECIDINPHMLERGRAMATERGLHKRVLPIHGDFNDWAPEGQYDAILANQCLHHVQNLEGLFSAIERSLGEHGRFITSDMIGRNGHQRWPEAEKIVRAVWAELGDRYKYNHQFQELQLDFVNHDCASESFEGIRAQDILPLLVERFGFDVFIAFGNVVDPFIDRGFGHNFSVDSDHDRRLIDRLHEIDEAGFADGTLSPTHLVAVMRRKGLETDSPYLARGLAPAQAVRRSG